MSNGRHSNNDIPFNPYSSSSWTTDQRLSSQNYLSPEDVYTMNSGSDYYAGSAHSYPTSRHSSESHSPSHSAGNHAAYQQPVYTQVASDYQQKHSYSGPPRHASTSGTPHSTRHSVSPAEYDGHSNKSHHSQDSNRHRSESQTTRTRHPHDSDKGKEKGKEAEARKSDGKRPSPGRHGEEDSAGRRKYGPARPPGEKLVNGVFLRY